MMNVEHKTRYIRRYQFEIYIYIYIYLILLKTKINNQIFRILISRKQKNI